MKRAGPCVIQSRIDRDKLYIYIVGWHTDEEIDATSKLVSLDDVQCQIGESHEQNFGQFEMFRRVADDEDVQQRLAQRAAVLEIPASFVVFPAGNVLVHGHGHLIGIYRLLSSLAAVY